MTGGPWAVSFASSVELLSENHRGAKMAEASRRAQLRRDATTHYRSAKFPAGLTRPSVEIRIEFPTKRGRDTANAQIIAKPIMDALGPDRSYLRKGKGGIPKPVNAPGVGLVDDDRPEFMDCEDCPHIRLRVLDPELVRRFPYGRITVTVSLPAS